MASPVATALLPIAVMGRPHGTAGELILRPYDPRGRTIESLALPFALTLVHGERSAEMTVTARRRTGDGFLVRLAGVATREAAAAWTNAQVCMRRDRMDPLAPGEYYVEDLTGCTARTEQGRDLGRVVGCFWNGAHDVMTIKASDGTEHLFPVVPDFILKFMGAERVVIVASTDEDVAGTPEAAGVDD